MTIEEYNYFIKKLKVIGYTRLKTVTDVSDSKGSTIAIDYIRDIYYRNNTVIAFNFDNNAINTIEFNGEAIRPTIEQTKFVYIVRSIDRLTLTFFKGEVVKFGLALFNIVIYPNSGIWTPTPMYSCFDSNDDNKKYLYSTSKNTMYVMHNGKVPCVICKENNRGKATSRRFYFIPEYNPDRVVYYFEFEHDLKEITHTGGKHYKDVSINIEKGEITFRLNPVEYFSSYLCSFRLHIGKLDDHEDWLKDSNIFLEKMR